MTSASERGPNGNPFGSDDLLPIEPLDPLMLAEVLERIVTRQERLENAVDALNRVLGSTAEEGPWVWRSLGPAQTAALFVDLRGWVNWLIRRYELRGEDQSIPVCWYRHDIAVEELTALMVAWRAAYTASPSPPSDALINWHDRWLWPTLHRLNTQLRLWSKCTGGTHHPGRPVPTPTGADDQDFARFLNQFADRSRPATALAPDQPAELRQNEIRALLNAGEGRVLFPDDPSGPVYLRGRWYAIRNGAPNDDLWTPVDDEQAQGLDALWARLMAVGEDTGDPS